MLAEGALGEAALVSSLLVLTPVGWCKMLDRETSAGGGESEYVISPLASRQAHCACTVPKLLATIRATSKTQREVPCEERSGQFVMDVLGFMKTLWSTKRTFTP